MSRSVRYEKQLRERANREKLFLVTVNVDGREAGDDSCTVQRIADVKLARKVAHFALKLMKSGVNQIIIALPILFTLGCAHKQVARAPEPPPAPEIRVIHSKLEGCTQKNHIATCECTPVSTRIDSKSGKTTVVCKIKVTE